MSNSTEPLYSRPRENWLTRLVEGRTRGQQATRRSWISSELVHEMLQSMENDDMKRLARLTRCACELAMIQFEAGKPGTAFQTLENAWPYVQLYRALSQGKSSEGTAHGR